jgi:hypothetical protein
VSPFFLFVNPGADAWAWEQNWGVPMEWALDAEKQLRLGLGQVLRYRCLLEHSLAGRVTAVLVL